MTLKKSLQIGVMDNQETGMCPRLRFQASGQFHQVKCNSGFSPVGLTSSDEECPGNV